jgi:hypothetical protein
MQNKLLSITVGKILTDAKTNCFHYRWKNIDLPLYEHYDSTEAWWHILLRCANLSLPPVRSVYASAAAESWPPFASSQSMRPTIRVVLGSSTFPNMLEHFLQVTFEKCAMVDPGVVENGSWRVQRVGRQPSGEQIVAGLTYRRVW